MSPGGKREGAGRKSSWTSGVKFADTTLIRIPEYLKEKILFLAHELDSSRIVLCQEEAENLKLEFKELKGYSDSLIEENSRLKDEVEKLKFDLVTNSNLKSGTGLEGKKIEDSQERTDCAKNNEKVTKSNFSEQLQLLNYESDFSKGLTTTDLAKRFKVSPTMISKKRKQSADKLAEYCKIKDPDNIIWEYNEQNKRFYPQSTVEKINNNQ